MVNGKTPPPPLAPGAVMRTMADNISKQAMAIAEGTEERIRAIQGETERGVEQLNEALARYQQTSRDHAAALAEAVSDQFGLLAQRIDDLTAHCNSAAQAFAEHHTNITTGLAALRNEVPPAPPAPQLEWPDEILPPEPSRTIPRMKPPRDER